MKIHGEGVTLYAQKKYDAARVKFHEAYARSQNPNSLFNEARCEHLAGHPLAAAKLLKVYLALPENDKVTASDRKEAAELLEAAGAGLCTLDVRAPTYFVDGASEQGAVLAEAGEHSVRMSGPSGERTRRVSCVGKQTVLVTYEEPLKPRVDPPPGERVEKGSWLLPVTLGVVGIGGLVVGGVLGVASSSTKEERRVLQAGGQCGVRAQECSDAKSSANAQATGSVVGYVAGGTFVVAAVVAAVLLEPWRTRKIGQGMLLPAVGRDKLGAAYSFSF